MQEVPETIPRCDQCGMHMPASRIFKHRKTNKFNKAKERRILQRDIEMAESCGEMELDLEEI